MVGSGSALSCILGTQLSLYSTSATGETTYRDNVSQELRLACITSVLMKLGERFRVYLCVHAYIHMHVFSFSTLLMKLKKG